MKILIKVTKDVLRRSILCGTSLDFCPNGAGENCAIALAIRDLFPSYYVGTYQIYRTHKTEYEDTICQLPAEASEFIKAFDKLSDDPNKRLSLPEFSFEIDVPMSEIERIGISEAYRILSESKTLELVLPK
jgi:hypothetical protein